MAPPGHQPLTAEEAKLRAHTLKALSDPVRLRIASLIASDPRGKVCVCDITPQFSLSQPTISHHLKVLKEAGLLSCERSGTWVYYWIAAGAEPLVSALLGPSAPTVAPDPNCC
ncbi:ArsR/SmtB family transcription factor [Hoyosella altamirensis]|uniref:ArsR family transcriptional regulator n=1 Tax=Hoyosella altamirensis TaxID=616997 RepID=A0A839RRB3_9ACTN|nr:metalloregulator ArsR/SmtB family transcription factor [Hoyosella altamirensis]MBB3039060.1 ArsR family transcriptional regulator [Hoyosella altamirensis]